MLSFKFHIDMYRIYAYNSDQMFLPNQNKIFGSHFIKLESPSKYEDTRRDKKDYYQEFEISRTHWLQLDHAESRCNPHGREGNTTACITEYLESKIGCSMGLQRSNSGVKRFLLYCITTLIIT